MKNPFPIWLACCLLLLAACGGSRTTNPGEATTARQVEERNRAVIPLITRIRSLPGMTLENGVPVFTKGNNSFQSGARSEPLYVVDGIAVGNSFRQIQDIVQPVDVATIKALSGAEASFYGSRGGSGVILITTRKGGS